MARPTSQGLKDNEALSANAEIMGSIQKYLNSSLETAQILGLTTDSLENFKRACETFTRAQYMNQGRLVLDEYQQQCRNKFGEESGVIFTIGVWMAGAEATAAYGRGFRRSERPGTYDLIVRNVGWLKDNAANIRLSQDQIDDLFANLNTDPGPPFYSIQDGLQQIRDSWRDELQNQPPIYQVFALTDGNFSDIVVQSDLPILVVFGPRFNPQTATLIKRIEDMVPHYTGKAKFGTAEPQTCPKIYQQEKIMKPPLVRLYKKGVVVGELKGEMSEEAIKRLIDDNISFTGLLGIEMQTPTTPEKKKKKKKKNN